jgi:hypothetical protein
MQDRRNDSQRLRKVLVADCGLLSCRTAPQLLRDKQLVVRTITAIKFSVCYMAFLIHHLLANQIL